MRYANETHRKAWMKENARHSKSSSGVLLRMFEIVVTAIIWVNPCFLRVCARMRECMRVCMHVCVCMHAYMCVYLSMYVYVFTCTYLCVCDIVCMCVGMWLLVKSLLRITHRPSSTLNWIQDQIMTLSSIYIYT